MDSYLEHLQQAISAATRDMTEEELERQPQGKWSVAEVLEHLYLTYTGTIRGFQRCVTAGKPLATAPTFKQRVFKLVVVNAGYMPSGVKAPGMTVPTGAAPDRVLQQVIPAIAEMRKLIALAETRFGTGTRVLDHPILGPLTAPEWRKLHWVHGRHHLKQIERMRASCYSGGRSGSTA